MSFLTQLESLWNEMPVGYTKSVAAGDDWESCVESFKAKYGQCCDVECRMSGSTTSSSVMTVFITKKKECVTPTPTPTPAPVPEEDVVIMPDPEELEVIEEPSGGIGDLISKFRIKPENEQ